MDWFLYDNGLRHERVKYCVMNTDQISENSFMNIEYENEYRI